MSRQQNLAVIIGLCGVFGLAAWVFYLRAFAGVFGEDWMVYDTAIRAYFGGQLGLLYDGERLTALLNEQLGAWLAHPLPLHPWLYPPTYLLLLLPFGLLPFAPAGMLFLALGFLALVAAGFAFARGGAARGLLAASFLLSPATAITVCLGQNTFLTAALMLGGFAALPRRPVVAGMLLGVLAYKPQLCLMVPVALLALGDWRAIAAAALTFGGMALLSIAVFGVAPWHDWFVLLTTPSALFEQWQRIARLNGQSIYAEAVLLGASPFVANLVQAVAALIAAATVWWCHRRPMTQDLRLAVLLAATVLAAPHLIDYDALLLGIAATLLVLRAVEDGFRFGDAILVVLVWTSPLANPPSVFALGFATPVLVLLFIAATLRRGWPAAAEPGSAALGISES